MTKKEWNTGNWDEVSEEDQKRKDSLSQIGLKVQPGKEVLSYADSGTFYGMASVAYEAQDWWDREEEVVKEACASEEELRGKH